MGSNSLPGPYIRRVGSSDRPKTAIRAHNFEQVKYRGVHTSGDVRGKYEDLEFSTTGSGEMLRIRGIAAGTGGATGGTINAIHATGRVASGGTISGALNAIRATLEVAGTTPTPGGTLAALQLDSNIVTGATMGNNDAFIRVTDSGATTLDNFINFADEAGCLDGTGGTYSTADGYIKIRVDGSDMRIPYFAGTD
jgi:hypothetical protein